MSTCSSQESLGGVASSTGPSSAWGGASPGLPRGVSAVASAVSIASMHQQKKRGIKSSLGRFFSKKEKAGMPLQQGQSPRSLASASSLGLSSLADESAEGLGSHAPAPLQHQTTPGPRASAVTPCDCCSIVVYDQHAAGDR